MIVAMRIEPGPQGPDWYRLIPVHHSWMFHLNRTWLSAPWCSVLHRKFLSLGQGRKELLAMKTMW